MRIEIEIMIFKLCLRYLNLFATSKLCLHSNLFFLNRIMQQQLLQQHFLNTFDPIIIEQYKETLLNKTVYDEITLPWEIFQPIKLRVNSNEIVEFEFLKDNSSYHIIYPMFGIYLHILLEFTNGDLNLVKNKIKITHEFDKTYHDSVVYLKTVINAINSDSDLNTMIYQLNPIASEMIVQSNIYYLMKEYMSNERNDIELLIKCMRLYCRFYFGLYDINYSDVKNKKFYINDTVKKKIDTKYKYSKFIEWMYYNSTCNKIIEYNNWYGIINYNNTDDEENIKKIIECSWLK